MKKIVLRYGLLGGLVVGLVVAVSTLLGVYTGHVEGSMIIGYASMILAFSLIFVALKNLRDKLYEGTISFGKAFKAAMLITAVTSSIYVAVWLICYYFFIPDFMEQYKVYTLNSAKANGFSEAEISKQAAQMQSYSDLYKNPLFVILFTYMEILPVGVIVSLVAALVIKRKVISIQPEQLYPTGTV